MSRLPADSPRFKEGLEWQWRNLDVCIDGRLDRAQIGDAADKTQHVYSKALAEVACRT